MIYTPTIADNMKNLIFFTGNRCYKFISPGRYPETHHPGLCLTIGQNRVEARHRKR